MQAEPKSGLASVTSGTRQLQRAQTALAAAFRYLAQPTVLPIVRAAIWVLVVLWLLNSLWRAVWSFVPEAAPLPAMTVINPVRSSRGAAAAVPVDIDALVAANLFGAPGTTLSPEELAGESGRSPAMSEAEAAEALAGIEDGAPETRLPLLLRGVVASSDAGLGQAVIEHSQRQDLYQVGDELPVNGEVTLAKVLPALIVLDNGGRYEVLKLFEDSELSTQNGITAASVAARQRRPVSRSVAPVDYTQHSDDDDDGHDAAELAEQYRDRLYSDPQSLSEVVRVRPAREDGELLGYQISPGSSAREFTTLGFKQGDIVTAVNGLSLSNPANLPRLHSAMRSASAASFDIERGGENITLTVDIGQGSSGDVQ